MLVVCVRSAVPCSAEVSAFKAARQTTWPASVHTHQGRATHSKRVSWSQPYSNRLYAVLVSGSSPCFVRYVVREFSECEMLSCQTSASQFRVGHSSSTFSAWSNQQLFRNMPLLLALKCSHNEMKAPWRPGRFFAGTKQFQNRFKTVLKLFCFGFISLCEQFQLLHRLWVRLGLTSHEALPLLQSMSSPLPSSSQLVNADSTVVRPPEPGACPWPVYRCNVDQKYRSWDGSCNNLADPIQGRSFTPLARYLPPDYADGSSLFLINAFELTR